MMPDWISRPGRTAERVVVLRAAIDVIERNIVVDIDVVKLSDRQVRFEVPVRSAVKALVHAAVAAHEHIIRVLWIDPDRVIVDVLEAFAERPLRAAGVVRDLKNDIRNIDPIDVLWIGDDLCVIHCLGDVRACPFPRRAAVVRAEYAARRACGFDGCVNDVRVRRRDRDTDAADIALQATAAANSASMYCRRRPNGTSHSPARRRSK